MKCPTCGKETKGVDHNKRGLRCTSCWARLPDKPARSRQKRKGRLPTEAELAVVLTEPEARPEVDKPRRRRKPATSN